MKNLYKIFLAVIIISILFMIIAFYKEDNSVITRTVSIRPDESEGIIFPTDKDVLLENLGVNSFYDFKAGFIFSKPENVKLTDCDEYYILSSSDLDGCIILISDARLYLNDSLEFLEATQGLKERLTFTLNDIHYSTALYDRNYKYINEKVENYETLTENVNVYLNHGIVAKSKYYNLNINHRGLSIGYINLGEDENKINNFCKEIIKTIIPVNFTGDPSLEIYKEISYSYEYLFGLNIKIPNNWEKLEIDETSVGFYSPVCTNNPLYNTQILIVKDDKKSKHNFDAIDYTYMINKKIYNQLIFRNKNFNADYGIDTTFDTEEENIFINGNNFRKVNLTLRLKSSYSSTYFSYPDLSFKAIHYLYEDKGANVNIIFIGLENISFEATKLLAQNIMEEIY